MKLTRAMIDSGKSDRGGWNRAQLQILGVSWPPQHGWPSRIIGKEISAKDYERFLELRGFHKRKKIGAPKRPPKEHAELFGRDGIDRANQYTMKLRLATPEDFANDLYNASNRDLA